MNQYNDLKYLKAEILKELEDSTGIEKKEKELELKAVIESLSEFVF